MEEVGLIIWAAGAVCVWAWAAGIHGINKARGGGGFTDSDAGEWFLAGFVWPALPILYAGYSLVRGFIWTFASLGHALGRRRQEQVPPSETVIDPYRSDRCPTCGTALNERVLP